MTQKNPTNTIRSNMAWRVKTRDEFLAEASSNDIVDMYYDDIDEIYGISDSSMKKYNIYGMPLKKLIENVEWGTPPEDTYGFEFPNKWESRVFREDGYSTSYEFDRRMFVWEDEYLCLLKKYQGVSSGHVIIKKGIGHIVEKVVKNKEGMYFVECKDGTIHQFGNFQPVHKGTYGKIL